MPKPFYIDVLKRKHESYLYDEAGSRTFEVAHEGRTIRLLAPEYMPPVSCRVTASKGDVLFLIGEQLDMEEEDGRVIEGGDGILIVALRTADGLDVYWTLAWHQLFPQTLAFLGIPEV